MAQVQAASVADLAVHKLKDLLCRPVCPAAVLRYSAKDIKHQESDRVSTGGSFWKESLPDGGDQPGNCFIIALVTGVLMHWC